MIKRDQVNAVALTLQDVMASLDGYYDRLVGPGQHNLVLVVGAGDVSQYIANRDRKLSTELLKGLLERWKVDLPDVLPETVTADMRPFTYLLNAFEAALTHPDPASQDLKNKRIEVLDYVGRQMISARGRA